MSTLNATDVFYTMADGTKGSFRAPSGNIEQAILLTKLQLIDDAIADETYDNDTDAADLFTITKAQVL